MSDYLDTREKLPLPINPLFYAFIPLVLLIRLISGQSNRKTIKETIYGFIPHKCKWNKDDVLVHENNSLRPNYHYYRCKYFGCNFVASKEFAEREEKK